MKLKKLVPSSIEAEFDKSIVGLGLAIDFHELEAFIVFPFLVINISWS